MADLDKRDTAMAEVWLDAVPEPTADEHLRNAVLSVLDAEDALRAAGVRSEAVSNLLATLRHVAARVTAANNALPRQSLDT
ncbi:MAG: hypothetical protein ACM3ZF_09775 [Mycobacterium leprae]